ncbi:MAG: polysaccharide deacetylase family protein [Endomicrobiia bacterium]
MKNTIKIIIGICVVIFSLVWFIHLKYEDKSFVLIYHRIEKYQGGLKSLYVLPKNFDLQMKYLYKRGYRTVSLEEMSNQIKNKKINSKNFCITFDDGYKNNLTYAYPILKKYSFKATVFVTVEAIGKKFGYPYMPEAEHMSVEELKTVSDVFEIGSHSNSHRDMQKISKNDVIDEVRLSKKRLEKLLGIDIKHFCYPFGKNFEQYAEVLSSFGYFTACSTKHGFVDINSDIFLLPRIEWKEISAMSIKDFFKNLDFYIKILFGI